jgi:cell division protein FtsL
MGAEPARVLEFPEDYIHGSAAPAAAGYAEPRARPVEAPMQEELFRQREKARAAAAAQNAPAVSLFAIFGTLFAGFLMIFVVLAQINYNEIAAETVRLNAQFAALTEQQRRLEIEYESAINMKEIEMYARDVLGMSRPAVDQVTVIYTVPGDRAEVIGSGAEEDSLREFGSFISSLLEYLRRR